MSRGSNHVLARTSIPVTAVSYTPVTYTGGTLTAGVASVTPSNATYSTPSATQVNAGTYSTSITGSGAFNKTVSANWTVNRASMVSVGFASQTYTGSALTPAVNAVNPAAATYTTSAIAKTNAGTYTDSSVTGTTNYQGTVTGSFVVNPASMVSFTIGAQTYTGSALTPAVASVNPAAATYSTSFTNQTNAGTYSNSITGTTNYSGTVNANFVVNPATVTAITWASNTYNGASQTPATASRTPGGATGNVGTAQTNAGSYTTTFTGTGNYTGSPTATWTINPASVTFSYSSTGLTYNGGAQGPVVSPSNGSATYSNGGTTSATNAGSYTITSTASGNWTGSGSSGWTIYQANQASVTVSAASSMTYGTGSTWYGGGGSGTGQMYWTVLGQIGNTAATSATLSTQLGANAYYTMRFFKAGDANYNQSNNADQSFYVNPASVTFSYSSTGLTYNGGAQGPTVTPSNGSATYSNGGTTSATNAGSYTITSSASGNYTGSGSSGWSIAAAGVSFNYTNTSLTYNGGAQGPTVNPSNGSATYSNGGTTSATNAGSYTITSSGTGNWSGSGSSGWSIAQADQDMVSISGPTTGTTGNSYSFTASGGNGDGAYVFGIYPPVGGSVSGNSNPNSVYFGSSGSYYVMVHKNADTNYSESNYAYAGISISNPIEYIYAGNIGGSNGTSYINVSWNTQQVHSGSPIYFYINAYSEDGGNIEWTDPYYTFWSGASGNYTVNSEGNDFFDKGGRNSFSGTFSITPNAPGYFNWGIRIYNPGAGVENHAVPIGVQVSY